MDDLPLLTTDTQAKRILEHDGKQPTEGSLHRIWSRKTRSERVRNATYMIGTHADRNQRTDARQIEIAIQSFFFGLRRGRFTTLEKSAIDKQAEVIRQTRLMARTGNVITVP